jgi:hypothetical protein
MERAVLVFLETRDEDVGDGGAGRKMRAMH